MAQLWEILGIWLVAILSILSLFLDSRSKTKKYIKVGIIIIIILIATGSTFIYLTNQETQKYSKDSGNLEFSKSELNLFPNIIYGGNTLINSPVSSINMGIPIDARIDTNHNLIVSAMVFNEDKKVLAKVENNSWIINPNQGAWQKNFDNDGFEVIDDNDEVVLQFDFVNQTTLFINGKFIRADGSHVFVNKDGIYIDKEFPQKTITRIFLYPTSDYPGVRVVEK